MYGSDGAQARAQAPLLNGASRSSSSSEGSTVYLTVCRDATDPVAQDRVLDGRYGCVGALSIISLVLSTGVLLYCKSDLEQPDFIVSNRKKS